MRRDLTLYCTAPTISHITQDRCLPYLADCAISQTDADISGTGVVLAFIPGADLTALLYGTKLFSTVVALINRAILATSVLVYIVDTYSIGNAKVPKWETTAECISLCMAGVLVIELLLIPFSILGRVGAGIHWRLERKLAGSQLLGGHSRRRGSSMTEMTAMKP